jgi:predicted ATPase/uncharacterized protein HemY
VTLVGTGGSGKTRLVLEVARRLVETWQGAVWFVPLADLEDASRLGSALRDALRLPRAREIEPLPQVIAALSQQPSLLILDNFEQLAVEGVPFLEALLEGAPGLTLLVTSRQRLNLAGEREFLVGPLPTPEGEPTPEELLRSESAQLFVDRAQEVRPDFQVTPRNAGAVAALCRRLEGIPLAIELAAARSQVLTPAQICARLSRRFELLVSRQRGPERHRSLRAALDWSYALLAPELKRFFARLSVFRGGFTLEAAEQVACDPERGLCEAELSLDYLAQLRECSLLLAEEGADEIRFRLLETLREYADEQLAATERATLARRHTEYFLDLAEAAEALLSGSEQHEGLARLEREHDNLRAALDWSVAQGETQVGLRLSGALWRFWWMRGYLTQGRERLAALLALPGASPRTPQRAKALHAASSLAFSQGEYPLSRSYAEESRAIFRELGDRQGLALALDIQGQLAQAHADYATARSLYEECLALERQLDSRSGIARALNNLASTAHEQGDYGAARALYEESLAIWREAGDRWGIATSLGYLGKLCHAQGEYGAARALYEESLAIQRDQLGSEYDVAGILYNLGRVAQAQGEYGTARAFCEECLAIRRELGDRSGISDVLNALGSAAREQGDYVAARALYEESLTIKRELGDRRGIAYLLHNLGRAAYEQGDDDAARALNEQSLALKREIGDRPGIASSLNLLGSLTERQGDYETARALHEECLAMQRELGNKQGMSWSLHNLGNIAHAQGDHTAARALYGESLAIERELGNRSGVAESLETLAGLAHEQGQPERAARLFGAAEALREAIAIPLRPILRPEYERQISSLRAALDQATLAAAWEAGRALTLDEAITLAMR